jgi:GNAT superfamily N-acetyltransferase
MTADDPYLIVRTLTSEDVGAAAALLGRGMADNPIHAPIYGRDESFRRRRHERLMRTHLHAARALRVEGVERGGSLVGIAASAPAGRCQPPPSARLRLLGRALMFGIGPASRLVVWQRSWARHDLDEPHVHLGPVSVDRHLRGHGIGSLLLLRHTGMLDSIGAVGYLETDRPEAVRFYGRFGYVVVGESDVLGVPCWFMRRPAF